MHRPLDYCPHCGCLRDLDLSLGMMTVDTQAGKADVLLYQYHCASCNAFVRSTTLDNQEVSSPSEYAAMEIPEYA